MTMHDQSWTLLSQYWLLPVAMPIVYFFAKNHFNSPDYPLSGYALADSAHSAKNSPNARLRTPAPPIFTTPRDRYRWAELKYIVGIEAGFIFLAFFPDLVAKIPPLKTVLCYRDGLADDIWQGSRRRCPVFLSCYPRCRYVVSEIFAHIGVNTG